MQLSRPVTLLAASALLAGSYAFGSLTTPLSPASAQEAAVSPASDGVTVAGIGTVSGTPDVLRLSLRAVVVRPTADVALRDASVVTNRVRAALRRQGVAAEDLQTTQLTVSPSYGGKPAKLVGYQVVQGLGAQLRDLSRAGQAVTDAVTAGGTFLRFDGVAFLLSDDSPLKVRARDAAFAQAKSKAEQYARLSGRTLGQVETVQEDVQPFYYGEGATAASGGSGDAALPIDPGTQRVDVRVVVRWSLR